MNKVYVIILNWNCWKDTIECLESVFRNNYPNYQVIVCDNDSHDESIEKIKAWADGQLNVDVNENNPLHDLSFPPVPKPINYIEYTRIQAEAGGEKETSAASIILIRTGANLGFAGGCNVGLRYILTRGDFSYVWLLNNDTVIKPDALTHLVCRMQNKPAAGMCGSTLPFYHEPDKIWALGGGVYNKWLAKTHNIGLFQSIKDKRDYQAAEGRMVYLAGASMLVSHVFLQNIGLMCEDYFLYFEELDWAMRSKRQFSLAYASESIVYHKVGASTSIINKKSNNNLASQNYMIKNKILFTRKFFPFALPTVGISAVVDLFKLWGLMLWRKKRNWRRVI